MATANHSKRTQKRLFLYIGIVGVLCALSANAYLIHERAKYSFAQTSFDPPSVVSRSLPTSISIPSVSINLSIEEGAISNGIWQVSKDKATHLTQSASPGENGNIIIYGHNKRDILGKLHQAEVNDMLILKTDTGKEHIYTIKQKRVVAPTAIEVVGPTTKEVLTVYTCTGFLDSKRLVLTAEPTELNP